MDTDNISLKEGIRSESCLVRYVAVVNAVLVTVIIVQEHRYVNADEKTVSLSRRVSVLLPDVIRAETGFPKKVTIVTAAGCYKRRFIRNNREIVKFINERCNNAAQ